MIYKCGQWLSLNFVFICQIFITCLSCDSTTLGPVDMRKQHRYRSCLLVVHSTQNGLYFIGHFSWPWSEELTQGLVERGMNGSRSKAGKR